jgi:hypothetical protein
MKRYQILEGKAGVGNQARTRNLLRGIAHEQSSDILEGARDGTNLTASVTSLGPGPACP